MTDHIAVLQQILDGTPSDTLHEDHRRALDAAITALSARASAGEGGDLATALRKWQAVLRGDAECAGLNNGYRNACEHHAAHIDTLLTAAPQPAAAQRWPSSEPGYTTLFNAIAAATSNYAGIGVNVSVSKFLDALAAAPQPQQAPAQEPSAVAVLVTAVNAVLAANPNDDTMWSLEAAVAPFNARRPDECTNGCPPQQVCDYCQVVAKYTTPPAHGDGEAQAWTYPNRNALIREVCEGLRGYRFDVDPVCVMAIINSIPAQVFSRMAPPALTTRPTPEAQEARDAADARRYRWLRSLPTGPGTSTIGDFHFTLAQHRPAPNRWCVDSVRGDSLDAAIDAALALPAQGEGKNG